MERIKKEKKDLNVIDKENLRQFISANLNFASTFKLAEDGNKNSTCSANVKMLKISHIAIALFDKRILGQDNQV